MKRNASWGRVAVRFSTKSKVVMAAGLSCSALFLGLGIREMSHPARSAVTPVTQVNRPVAMLLPLAAAARPIAVGETITAALVRTVPGNATHNQTIASPAEAIGKVAVLPIAAGSMIDRAAIGTESKLAIRVPVGMRAMSIDTTAEIAVAGLVRPGDRVDVQVVYPGEDSIGGIRGGVRSRSEAKTLLQMVQVLAVGDLVVGQAGPAAPGTAADATATPLPPARTVTLALSPEQVSTLSLAKNVGGLYLSLRNPTDQATVETPKVWPSAVPTPRMAAAAPARRANPRRNASRPTHAIELVMGDRHEIIQAGGTGQ